VKPVVVVAVLVLALGCERPELNTGSECALNSDCAAPLICGLERCRRQCIDSRDCGAGLLCLAVGDQGGACQLPEEADCTLTSECTRGLECRFGTCTTACAEDRDCPMGATCELDGDVNACHEQVTELCIYNSDCPAPRVCGRDQLCHYECARDRDCPIDRYCDLMGSSGRPATFLCEMRERLDGG